MYTLCQYGPANLNRRITAPLPPCQCWKSHQLSRFWRQSNLTWRLMGWDFFGGTFADRGSSTCLLTFLCSISFVITNILNHKTHPPPSFQCCQCWKSNQISRFWRQSDLTWRLMGWDFFSGTFAGRGSSTCLLTFLCSISFVITNILNHKTHPPPSFQCWVRSRNFVLKSVFVDFFTRITLLRTTFNIEKEGGGAA